MLNDHISCERRIQTCESFVCRVLVASDALARGMDFEGVDFVLNYDMPVHARTYVHRAGRTARASRAGHVVTLLRNEHSAAFAKMMKESGISGVKNHAISEHAWQRAKPSVERALNNLQHFLAQDL
jgi:ATP-dependent RNA helicase DDX51/DBP6